MGIKGKIEDISIPDLIQIVSISERSGKLFINRVEDRAIIAFDKGKIIQAFSTAYKKNIGDILIEKKFISESDLDEALKAQKELFEWKQLGGICMDRGFIDRENLQEAIKILITEIISDLLDWEDGSFNFEVGDSELGDDINIDMRELILRSGLSSDFLLLEGASIHDKRGLKHRKQLHEKEPQKPKEAMTADVFPESKYFNNAGGINVESPDQLLKGILEEMDTAFFDELKSNEETQSVPNLSSEGIRVLKIYSEIKKLKDLLRKVDTSVLSQEFSFAVMRFASEFVSRVLLFNIEDRHARCIGHMGISEERMINAMHIRNMQIPLDQPSFLSKAMDTKEINIEELKETHWNKFLVQKIGGKTNIEILVLPINITGDIRFMLYADNYPQDKLGRDIAELEAFIYQAGMALEITLLERSLKRAY